MSERKVGEFMVYDETIYGYGKSKTQFVANECFVKQYNEAVKEGDSDWLDMFTIIKDKLLVI